MINTKSFKLTIVAFLFGVCTSAHSALVYDYTGNNYESTFTLDSFDPVRYTIEMRITGSITLTESLGASHSIDTAVTPDTFSFSDGMHTFTNDNTDLAHFFFETDTSGTIIDWKINLNIGYPDPASIGDTIVLFASWGAIDSAKINECLLPASFGGGCTGITRTQGQVQDNPGTWVISSVPAPAALWLFGSGLLGLVGIARRQKA